MYNLVCLHFYTRYKAAQQSCFVVGIFGNTGFSLCTCTHCNCICIWMVICVNAVKLMCRALLVYNSYGAYLITVITRYRSLEIKNIMQESMSHHIFPQLLTSPLWSQVNCIMNEYLKFHEDYMKEAADLTFLAYRHCNYSKVSGILCRKIF